jgi:hypothetical protein
MTRCVENGTVGYLRQWEKIWDDRRVRDWIAACNERRLPSDTPE